MSIRRLPPLLILIALAGCGAGGGQTDEGASLRDIIPHVRRNPAGGRQTG